MWCGIVTLFPEMFRAVSESGITRRAVERGLLTLDYWNPRSFTEDKHQTVDDRPYGGGPGMVMQVAPLYQALQAAKQKASGKARILYPSPQGRRLDANSVRAFATEERLIFVAGRYEGIDERLFDLETIEEWSIGDYVLSGGELAVMVMIDTITRWLPGALGHTDSAAEDSFVEGLLDCPHYTRPEVLNGFCVPEVLLSGDHAAIETWRLKQKLGRTWLRRPDLLEKCVLTAECETLLQEFIREFDERSEL